MKELNKMQKWIPGFEGIYYADINGKIWRVSKTVKDSEVTGSVVRGKYIVKLRKDNKSYGLKKQQLIWKSFNGDIPKGYIVVRKNGITKDTYLQNLTLRSKSEHGKKTGHRSRSREVVQFNDKGEEINSFRSARRAASSLHCSYSSVSEICNKKVKAPIFNLMWEEDVRRKKKK
jgi:hypothetical protein